jgi:hypothetical protein
VQVAGSGSRCHWDWAVALPPRGPTSPGFTRWVPALRCAPLGVKGWINLGV